MVANSSVFIILAIHLNDGLILAPGLNFPLSNSRTIFAVNISPFTIYEGCDSCVFKQMGLAILSGKTPYLDLFDHKGPVIYFINAL